MLLLLNSISIIFFNAQDFTVYYSKVVNLIATYYYGRPAKQMRTLYFAAVVSSFSFFFFPRLFIAVAEWMSTILPYIMWP